MTCARVYIKQLCNKIYREGKSIKEAVELACHEDPEKINLDWYLALTDSIVGTIQCADGGSADQAKHLDEVIIIYICIHN